jgi:hypothetical protein
MRDWNEEVERLQIEKQNEEKKNRLELVADEISELNELETEFENAGLELAQCKQEFEEISDRNSPEIEEATQKLDAMKFAISEIDVDWKLQDLIVKNSNSEVIKQQMQVFETAAHKGEGALEFAEWMAASQKLSELRQIEKIEKEKVKKITDRFYELKAVPEYAVLDRRIRELKDENWKAFDKIAPVERDRRQMNARMNLLRSVIAKAD